MSDFKLVCATTVDLPERYLKEREIQSVPFHFTIENKDYEDDFGKSISYEVFYRLISNGAMPTTSQANVADHLSRFEPILQEGKDILYICFSSGLSGTFNCANATADELLERYPNRKIKIVDSLGASSGYGLLVDTAADMRDAGVDLEGVYQWVEENKLHVHHWFFSTDLQHYKRGGRISGASATVGTLLNICPLMNMDNNGKLIPRQKIRGKKKAIKEMVSKMEQHAQDGAEYTGKCFISHSACYEDTRQVADLISQHFPKLAGEIMINDIGTVVGAHTGPGTVALFFFGDQRIN